MKISDYIVQEVYAKHNEAMAERERRAKQSKEYQSKRDLIQFRARLWYLLGIEPDQTAGLAQAELSFKIGEDEWALSLAVAAERLLLSLKSANGPKCEVHTIDNIYQMLRRHYESIASSQNVFEVPEL